MVQTYARCICVRNGGYLTLLPFADVLAMMKRGRA